MEKFTTGILMRWSSILQQQLVGCTGATPLPSCQPAQRQWSIGVDYGHLRPNPRNTPATQIDTPCHQGLYLGERQRETLSLGGKRMTILHPFLHRRRHWLILATVALVVMAGLVIYGHRSAAPPAPEQLCRERLGLSRQTADSAAGTTLLGACINDVTHARRNPPSTPSR